MNEMRPVLLFSALFLVIWVSSGCYYDSNDYLYPGAENAVCDTTNITYSGTINPIIVSKCNVCHSKAAPLGNIVTDDYASLQVLAANGKLYGAVSHSSGFKAMPNDGSTLSKCQILYIKIWAAAGAKNN